MLAAAGKSGVPAVRVWAPGRSLAFGRRDAHADGYDRAKSVAREHGFPPVERSVGGRAVAYAESTLAFAHAIPLDDARTGLNDRYESAVATVLAALRDAGADVDRGEPPASYCPGDYSVRVAGGGKVAGVAQRVRQDAALVSGCVTVAERGPIRAVLRPVYEALDVPFDPHSVGSVARAGGPADPETVREALESGFVGDRAADVRDVASLPASDD
ncbi:lipoate--protein ligase family protein [Halobaculum magnesiiphilum]|uniref:Lipoate--protein ligase family protein n=1 Tax=Halobaculum magnesiiphilum TaxID=1017351 RepID=A0A8T8WGU6_9EURY|nr:lipoate--protein ligase family protein [Halobaculum magnesiiphilum]QZP39067.1 lipoate--protein ligase family protein [Halobaculum magnesiiphilum]